jgi:hypothetical protein
MTYLDADLLVHVIGGKAAHPTMVTDCWHASEKAADYARWGDRRASYYQRRANQCWADYRKLPKKF